MKKSIKLLGILALTIGAMHTQAAAAEVEGGLVGAVRASGGVVVSSRDALVPNMDDLVARGGIIDLLDGIADSDTIVASFTRRGGKHIVGSYIATTLLNSTVTPESSAASDLLVDSLLARARAGSLGVEIIRGEKVTVPGPSMATADRLIVGGLRDFVKSTTKPIVVMENEVEILDGTFGIEPGVDFDLACGGCLIGKVEGSDDFPVLIWGNKVTAKTPVTFLDSCFKTVPPSGYAVIEFAGTFVYVRNTVPMQTSAFGGLMGLVCNGSYVINNTISSGPEGAAIAAAKAAAAVPAAGAGAGAGAS